MLRCWCPTCLHVVVLSDSGQEYGHQIDGCTGELVEMPVDGDVAGVPRALLDEKEDVEWLQEHLRLAGQTEDRYS